MEGREESKTYNAIEHEDEGVAAEGGFVIDGWVRAVDQLVFAGLVVKRYFEGSVMAGDGL